MDPDGRAVLSLGETGKRVFPRSAVKGLQALCLIETGAADRYGAHASGACACVLLPFRRAAPRRDGGLDARQGRARSHLPRMRHALAFERAGGARARGRRTRAHGASQQLLGKAFGLHLRRLRHECRSERLCAARSRRAAADQGRVRGDDGASSFPMPRAASTDAPSRLTRPRSRRWRSPSRASAPGRSFRAIAPRRRGACAKRWRQSPSWSPAAAASTRS